MSEHAETIGKIIELLGDLDVEGAEKELAEAKEEVLENLPEGNPLRAIAVMSLDMSTLVVNLKKDCTKLAQETLLQGVGSAG